MSIGFWLTVRFLSAQSKQLSETFETAYKGQGVLLDKALAMLGTKDPLSFQSVQYMTPGGYDSGDDYDPSPDGEIARIAARQGTRYGEETEGDLNASELAAAQDLADFGFDGL